MLNGIDFNVLLKNKRVILMTFINLITICIYIFLGQEDFINFIEWYYIKVYMLLVIAYIIVSQSINYIVYTNVNVILRFKSSLDVYKKILLSDFILVLYFWLVNIVGCVLISSVGGALIKEKIPFLIFMFVWTIFYTLLKHFIFVLIENYNIASVISIIVLIVIRITTDVYFSSLYTMIALFVSIVMLFYVLNAIKKDEYLIRGKDER